MATQYANTGNPISQALSGLTQYLMIENERLDAKNKEKRINLAAEQIAEKYQNLPPDATIGDIQKLQYQLIEDAAALGGLEANLPLMSSLYQNTLASRQMEKAERQDTALYNYVSKRYGLDLSPEVGGTAAFNLAQFKRQGEREVNTMEESGKTSLKIFDESLKEIGNIETSAVGFDTQWSWKKKEMDYQYGQQLGA